MINYSLQKEVIIDDKVYKINKDGDYRVILDIIDALNDNDLSENEKAYCALNIFYDFDIPLDYQAAIDEMMLFINCGEKNDSNKNEKPIMNWSQDFKILISPINKVLGKEIRALEYLHWWTFVSAYMEIGECTFSQVITIRKKLRSNKKLTNEERAFYKSNFDLVNLKNCYTDEEKEIQNLVFGD